MSFLLSSLFALAVGAALAAGVELTLIRPLYRRHIEQVLVTVGLAFVLVALVQGIWDPTERVYEAPSWLFDTTEVFGRRSRTTASSRSPPRSSFCSASSPSSASLATG